MVRRDKTTIFLDCKEATTVYELKKMVEGIMKKAPDDQRLYKDDQILDDAKTLEDCGFTTQTAKAQSPALIKLSFRGEGIKIAFKTYAQILITSIFTDGFNDLYVIIVIFCDLFTLSLC